MARSLKVLKFEEICIVNVEAKKIKIKIKINKRMQD
jgi:hypothetical protein